jgi:hypothetical protein
MDIAMKNAPSEGAVFFFFHIDNETGTVIKTVPVFFRSAPAIWP